MGRFDYEDGELEEEDPSTEGYTKVADLTGPQTYQRPIGEIQNSTNLTESTSWTLYEDSTSKIVELQGSSQQINVPANGQQSGTGVLESVDRRVEFTVPVDVAGKQETLTLTLEIPASETTRSTPGVETKVVRAGKKQEDSGTATGDSSSTTANDSLSDGRDCIITFELTCTKNQSDNKNYLSSMRLVSTIVGNDTATMNYRIRFKMPVNDTDKMDLTLDVPSGDMSRDTAGTQLKKVRKYYNGDACLINFRLNYEMNQEEKKAYVTSMTLASAYFARSNVTETTTWSVWHD